MCHKQFSELRTTSEPIETRKCSQLTLCLLIIERAVLLCAVQRTCTWDKVYAAARKHCKRWGLIRDAAAAGAESRGRGAR
jgi:hypothetical protein